MFIDFVFNIR